MKKYASMTILSASLAPSGGKALRAFAHRHHFTYEPRPGFLYVRSRAISSRCNDNYDEFPAEEIKKAYATFIGKPVFVNHHNDNHRRARGVIIDAALHEDRNHDNSPDTWCEVLMEVDAVRFPKLAKAILAGHVDRTSMGTDVAFSKCSVCNNKATNPTEYCQHIPKMKGQRIYRTTASGRKEGVLVREICHGLGFFENSLLVEEPADPTAFFLGVDDHSGLSKGASKTAKPASMPGHSAPSKRETGHCATCGKAIYHVENSAMGGWQHDIDGASGVPHQAIPAGKQAATNWKALNPNEWDNYNKHFDGGPKYGTCENCGDTNTQVVRQDAVMGNPAKWVGVNCSCKKTSGYRADPTNPLHQHLVEVHAIDPHLLNKRDADYLHALHHEQVSDEAPTSRDGVIDPDGLGAHGEVGHHNVFHIHLANDHLRPLAKVAYGETMAPADVDTLRDEECPVCGEADAYDGNECQVCGFVTPPKMFLDPDVDMAKNLDLRKDVAEQQSPGEDLNGDGMPDSIPGSTQPGSDATGEVDPTMLDENGQPVDPQTGVGLTPDADQSAVDPATGLPIDQPNDDADVDPENIDPETGLPVQVNDDVDPNAMAPDGQLDSPGSQLPGDANDGVPDLICPACGFETPSAVPTSVNTADPAAIPAGAAQGDVCPNCQQALLESISDAEGAGIMPDPKQPPVPVQ